mmetsp:Transcript_29377/g.55003  ORF Transcript_29377/g.55003 Transcript_29377/m.55003 type:complete len:132 (-) Transcript_29377:176-571(-)|eukprot:CAMPEP_0170187012 /NCGR_PEP_ID=MMETSP0040_2-20121228/40687_1 /TAXON_ID=641309 /ORGANISM="Lotharella oceanica, Strain CCMP622" /LENGTH=131 /DNA_ID=CAMNT_0010433923 /DNA_START=362 /DNA_END=757 /DNA_ORIENTATION=-
MKENDGFSSVRAIVGVKPRAEAKAEGTLEEAKRFANEEKVAHFEVTLGSEESRKPFRFLARQFLTRTQFGEFYDLELKKRYLGVCCRDVCGLNMLHEDILAAIGEHPFLKKPKKPTRPLIPEKKSHGCLLS